MISIHGRHTKGDRPLRYRVTLSSIPLFVRAGAIIPMALNQMDNLSGEKAEGIRLLCAPDRDRSFTLYEDDGMTEDYKKGGYLKTRITMTAGIRTVLSFRQEGNYETAVNDMEIDLIHRGKRAPFGSDCGWGSRCLISFTGRSTKQPGSDGITARHWKSVQIKYPNPQKRL